MSDSVMLTCPPGYIFSVDFIRSTCKIWKEQINKMFILLFPLKIKLPFYQLNTLSCKAKLSYFKLASEKLK